MDIPKSTNSVYLNLDSYLTMMKFAQENTRKEIIGAFFGKICENGDINVLEAYSFRVGRRTEVHFNDSDYEKILPNIIDCSVLILEWLGWFHSHPFKRGDHIYMSNTDLPTPSLQNIQNPYWTAIVCNPHQIKDPSTTRGMRAFRLYYNTDDLKLTKKVIEIPMIIK